MADSPKTFSGQLSRPRWCYRQWMLAGNPAFFFHRLVQDFGDFVHYRGLFNFYLVNHPSLVKQVLMDTHKTFNKQSIIYRRFATAFGDGLVMAEGEKWKRQRSMMQPMFGPTTVSHFFPAMATAVNQMMDEWQNRCPDRTVFDVAEDMSRLTLRIAGRIFFSDGFDDAAARIGRWTKTVNWYCAKPPLPIIRQYWFPSSVNRRMRNTLAEFHLFIREMIEARQKYGSKEDLLGILLAARHENDGTPMTRDEITEEVLGMIIGGHESSSSALIWIWYELNRNPKVEALLHQEIDEIVGEGPLQIEHIERLKLAKMVIDECLRLHPPFWFENRNATCDLELGGVALPAGALVAFSRYSLHRHPDFWQDPERFDPFRHDPDCPENVRSTYAMVPFGGGPRTCIGINFAVMELMVILVIIARRFRVRVAKEDRHEMAARLTMVPKYGLKVWLEPRS